MKKIETLDGLRAISALGIAIMHVQANVPIMPKGNFLYDKIIPSFTDFVYLFFVISAFALCCGYYDKFKNGKVSLNDFYSKRYSRILPFFFILIFLTIVIPHSPNKYAMTNQLINESGFTPFIESIFEGFADMTLCYALLPNPHISVVGVGWFLGVIFLFYMLFPFFVFMIDNKKRAWFSLSIAYIFTFINIAYFFGPKFIDFSLNRKSILYDTSFFILGGLIFLYKEEIISKFTSKKKLLFILCWILTFIYWVVKWDNYSYVIVVGILSSVWLMYAICSNGRILNTPILRYLGGISMEIYLSHMMCFRAISLLHLDKIITNHFVYFWIVSIGTIVGAIIFSHIVKYILFPLLSKLKMIYFHS